MDKVQYLLGVNKEEVYKTWKALGSLTINENVLYYQKDTLFRVNVEGDLKDALVYCKYSYMVDNENGFGPIDWADVQPDELDGTIYLYQGVASPNFKVVQKPEDFNSIDDSQISLDGFVPFNNPNISNSLVKISDEDYRICVAELGVPFLREEELEYNRDTIIDICIKPAVDMYFSYFPIVIDQDAGFKNGEWMVEYHDFPTDPDAIAYKGITYLTNGGSGGTASGWPSLSSPLAYIKEISMGGGGFGANSTFSGTLNYRKRVPGFSGMSAADAVQSALLSQAGNQAIFNQTRKEYDRDVFINGKKYLHGWTTSGGYLNIHWLCTSNNFDRIPFTMKSVDVRRLCTAFALRNIGMLRALVPNEKVNKIDYSLYNTRADAIEEKIFTKWDTNPMRLRFAIQRGGGNF